METGRRKMRRAWAVGMGLAAAALLLGFGILVPDAFAAPTVPTDIKMPGTQQAEVPTYVAPTNCDNCHGGTDNPELEPNFGWRGGMMANATRDGLFWATLAIAEQDFLPGTDPDARGGAGDLCLRCHSVNGWIADRSTPTDGSALQDGGDTNGVECEFCHLMVNPDQPVTVAGTEEVQNPPFEAYDDTTGDGYHGGAEYVINGNGTRLGPYVDAAANHGFIQSPLHRQSEFCATCHDVSNPAVGDLAPNNGAQIPLDPGTFSGVPGSAVDGKAAFNNFPHQYGIVERTTSEHVASAMDDWLVNDFGSLPAELQVAGGAFEIAYHRAYDARSDADYEDGTPRYYTCQTCHMAASTGVGCDKNGVPVRTDLPRHDHAGGQYWMPDVVQYQDNQGTLLMGGGLSTLQQQALDGGKIRAENHLRSAADLDAWQDGADLVVKITNLTGHKLISGYPEGRRMWINVKWYDAGTNLLAEDGGYGNIGRTVDDLGGTPHEVQSILDLDNTVIYEAEMGMDQAWADLLVNGVSYDAGMILSYDRMTDATDHTLGDLAGEPAGTQYHTFHFVLNNVVVSDHRIPPYGFDYDIARERNCLPVPEDQYGSPGAGGTYDHWDEVRFTIPDLASSAQVRLYYQQTSWEYIQFLWLNNDGLGFLGNEGVNMLDAWCNTGMSAPFEMALAGVNGIIPPVSEPPGEVSHQDVRAEHVKASWDGVDTVNVDLYTPACATTGGGHAVYWGPLADVSTYGYTDAACITGEGDLSFTPAQDSVFFLIVGNNGIDEGSYGLDWTNAERPEATGLAGCDWPQDLGATCDVGKRGN